LMKRSNDRISTNQDFVYIREDIEEYRKAQADKTVSLNEKQRLKEKEEADARQKARDKELRARKDAEEKVYEITLKQVHLPGLPPPVAKTNQVATAQSEDLDTAPDGDTSNGANPDEAKLLTFDWNAAYLQEAERILVDYLQLLPKNSPLIANQGERAQ
jgi:hypothetical protein